MARVQERVDLATLLTGVRGPLPVGSFCVDLDTSQLLRNAPHHRGGNADGYTHSTRGR